MAENSDVIPSTTQVQRFGTQTIPLLIQKYNSCSGTAKNLARLHGNENFYLWKRGIEYALSGTFAPTGHNLWEIAIGKTNIGHLQGSFIEQGLGVESVFTNDETETATAASINNIDGQVNRYLRDLNYQLLIPFIQSTIDRAVWPIAQEIIDTQWSNMSTVGHFTTEQLRGYNMAAHHTDQENNIYKARFGKNSCITIQVILSHMEQTYGITDVAVLEDFQRRLTEFRIMKTGASLIMYRTFVLEKFRDYARINNGEPLSEER